MATMILMMGVSQTKNNKGTCSRECTTPFWMWKLSFMTPWCWCGLTLLYKRSVNEPHGVVQSCGGHGSHGEAGRVEPVQQVHQDPNEEHGAGNACPQWQVEGCQAGKHVHRALSFAQQNAHGIVHVAHGKVHHALSLGCDGQGRESHVGSLREAQRGWQYYRWLC